jgi:hypothetical protein
MPRGRYNNLAVNPYDNFQLDVQYFNRKALEKQQRHDVARENYSKFAQEVANQSYLDPEARKMYLEQQQQVFDDAINKNAGNLSAGYQDILSVIEKSKNNPYHNLNKRQIEQAQIRQSLVSKYGDKAIDLSNINGPLYQRDSEGNVTWSNPNDIQANVVEANDYAQIIEKMLADTKAHEFGQQTGLEGGSGNAFYLMSKITQGEVLSPQELMQIASDPSVQQAFLANANTAGIDNRKVPGTDMTYKDMLTNPQGLAQFIYGNIQDKQRNNVVEKKQFVKNVGLEKATEHRNKLAEIDYQKKLATEPTLTSNWGKVTHDAESYNKIVQGKEDVQNQLKNIKSENTKLTRNFLSNFGVFDLGMNGKQDNISKMGQFTNRDGSFNKNAVGEFLVQQGINPNSDLFASKMRGMEAQFRQINENLTLETNLQKTADEYSQSQNIIDKNLYSKYYDKIKDTDKSILNKLGIYSKQDFLDNINKLTRDVDVVAKERVGYISNTGYKPAFNRDDFLNVNKVITGANTYKVEELRKGVPIESISKVKIPTDKNSQAYKLSQDYTNFYKNVSAEQALGNFVMGNSGKPVLEYYPGVKQFLEDNPNTKVKLVVPHTTTKGTTGNAVGIQLFVPKTEDTPEQTIELSNVKDVNNKAYFDERQKREIASNLSNYDFSNKNDIQDFNRDMTDRGSNLAGEEIDYLVDKLSRYDNTEQDLDVVINTKYGQKKVPITFGVQTVDGRKVYYIEGEGIEDKIINNPEDAKMLGRYLYGAVDVKSDPQTPINTGVIQKGMYELKSNINSYKVKE